MKSITVLTTVGILVALIRWSLRVLILDGPAEGV